MNEIYFIIDYYDEDEDMRYQFHYWTKGKYCYGSIEREDGVTISKKRISEKRFISAYENYKNY